MTETAATRLTEKYMKWTVYS